MDQLITFTTRAVAKIKQVIQEEQNLDLNFRMFVQGGGCQGLSYAFVVDEVIAEDDHVYVNDGIRILVDSLSYQYLTGSSVDYVESISGSHFVISNPMATSSCSCGSSFSA